MSDAFLLTASGAEAFSAGFSQGDRSCNVTEGRFILGSDVEGARQTTQKGDTTMNTDKARLEKEDALLLEVGRMFSRNQRQAVDPEKTKRILDAYVRARAEGRPAEDLSVEEVWILGERCANDKLPLDVAETLGFKPGATYGELVLESLTEAQGQERVSQMVNSREVVAIQIPRMGNIVQVIKPKNGLEGMVGEVKHFGDDGLAGVEFPGWGKWAQSGRSSR
jgi:hypothetical protein